LFAKYTRSADLRKVSYYSKCSPKLTEIVYYVMRSKNGVLCAAAGSLAAEQTNQPKHTKPFPLRTTYKYYFFFKPS
jgi:hypothetical protein